MSNLSPANTQPISKTTREQFLKFYLDATTKAMLPIGQITEVLKIELGQIVPIPQMPSWVMGVYNWRGDVLWTIDLGHLMGFTPWYQADINFTHHHAIVLSLNKAKNTNNIGKKTNLGLVIRKIEDLEICNVSEIQSALDGTNVTATIASFVEGYWLQPNGEIISVLKGQAIVASMPNT